MQFKIVATLFFGLGARYCGDLMASRAETRSKGPGFKSYQPPTFS